MKTLLFILFWVFWLVVGFRWMIRKNRESVPT